MDTSEKVKPNHQISMRDVFWVTTATAVLLAYAGNLGEDALSQSVSYGLMVIVCGTIVGSVSRQFKSAFFWSALIGLMAFLAVAGGRLPNQAVMLGWGMVGSGCGAVCGAQIPKPLWLGSLLSAVLGASLMTATIVVGRETITGLIAFDIACAGLVGLLLRPFVQFLIQFQSRSGQPAVLLAAWLTLAVLLGNLLVPVIAGVAR